MIIIYRCITLLYLCGNLLMDLLASFIVEAESKVDHGQNGSGIFSGRCQTDIEKYGLVSSYS